MMEKRGERRREPDGRHDAEAAQRRDAGGTSMIADIARHAALDASSLGEACAQQRAVDGEILSLVLTLAIAIAREGREGRKIGTIFTVGDAEAVFERSHPLILDPLQGHPDEEKHIGNPGMQETVKELAQLDGAFVIDARGVVRSAARYLDASSEGIDIPRGLGSRHVAGASVSRLPGVVCVVVSESSVVRLFDEGELIAEIIPELWMMRRYGSILLDEGVPTEKIGGEGEGPAGEVFIADRA